MIDEGLSRRQYTRLKTRLFEQAEGEQQAGIAQPTPSGQYVNTLINKGLCFARCIEQDPEAVQAGPVIKQLLNESLGKGWICHSFLANGADPGGYPQGLHMDQGPLLPWMTQEAPALVNTMFLMDDVNEINGGTIMVFDGRLLHGTGVNRSDQRRFVMTKSNVKPWMRTQEYWVLSVKPEILEWASPYNVAAAMQAARDSRA